MYTSIDVFAGMGGLTQGMHKAGFNTLVAIENEKDAVRTYEANFITTKVILNDIRKVVSQEILNMLNKQPLHLLAGCPPCQGFSSLRRLNRKRNIRDNRNSLILEYLRLVKELNPYTLMMENVPGLKNYYLFREIVKELKALKYRLNIEVLDASDYGVPQRRKRLVLVGSRLGNIYIAKPRNIKRTVKDAIGHLPNVQVTDDALHKIYPRHCTRILERIKNIPLDGGSLQDAGKEHQYKCHEKSGIGFRDVFGRMKWDDVAPTITGGCLNPSKGRFLHPVEDRCITAREALLLQTFPEDFKIPVNISKTKIASLMSNCQ